jgi:hypothetical protein
MKAGNFNFDDYMNRLNEESDKIQVGKGYATGTEKDGILIPDENKKSYDWLKKEYQKGQTEVKVEMKLGDSKFEPGYDMQTKLDSVKDFKPGMFGEVKTEDTEKKPAATKKTEAPDSPIKDKKDEKKPSAESKDPKTGKEATDKPAESKKPADKNQSKPALNIDAKTKKDDKR